MKFLLALLFRSSKCCFPLENLLRYYQMTDPSDDFFGSNMTAISDLIMFFYLELDIFRESYNISSAGLFR